MHIVLGRGVIFACTVLLFLIVLGDDHVFEDSTLPQLIESHMTNLARSRHGDRKIDTKTGEELKEEK